VLRNKGGRKISKIKKEKNKDKHRANSFDLRYINWITMSNVLPKYLS